MDVGQGTVAAAVRCSSRFFSYPYFVFIFQVSVCLCVSLGQSSCQLLSSEDSAAAAVAKNPVNASVLNPAHSNTQPLSIITSNPPEAPVAQYAEAAVGSAQNKQPMGGAEGIQSLRECPFQAGHPSGGSVTNDVDLSDDYIRSFLKVEVSHESCNMIRTIHNKLRSLVAEGISNVQI